MLENEGHTVVQKEELILSIMLRTTKSIIYIVIDNVKLQFAELTVYDYIKVR